MNFDILFSARTPNGRESRQIFINVESQNDWDPGYPLLKRAFYYCGRLLSRQKGIVFQNSDYQKLRKIYSLWVCLDPPKSKQNTLTAFHMKEENLVGNAKYDKMDYDMVSMMMICLGQPDHRQEDIIHLLSVLLSTKMDPDVKKEILEREYDIPMTIEMKKEAETMCGIGHAIARKNLEKGIEQGIEKGLEKGRMEEREANIVAMLKEKIPMETISRITHYSLDQIQKLGKLHGLL